MADELKLSSAEQARRSPFADGINGPAQFMIAWDSTSLGLFKECPRKYYYQIILGWRPKGESVHLKFGQLYHSGMEAYDHFAASIGKLEGGLTDEEHDAAIRAALLHVFRQAGSLVTDEETGLTEWKGWRSEDPYKNMWTLCRSIVWYLDAFRGRPLRTMTLRNGNPAVEVSFYFDGGQINGTDFGFCGHFDRMAENPEEGGRKSIHDRKTTKGQLNARYWKSFNPHNQFGLYTAASSIHFENPVWGITVDAAQVLVNSTAFQRQFIPFPPALVNEYLEEANIYISLAYRYAEMGKWPRNDKSCGNYGGCPFIDVCSKSESFRQNWLESDYTIQRWNPLEIRGDI